MGKRRTREQIERLLREADRDLGKGLTLPRSSRKAGISQEYLLSLEATLFDSAKVDEGRQIRQLESEAELNQDPGSRAAVGQEDAPGHRQKKLGWQTQLGSNFLQFMKVGCRITAEASLLPPGLPTLFQDRNRRSRHRST